MTAPRLRFLLAFAFAALLWAGTAEAGTIATLENNDGGNLHFTNLPCKHLAGTAIVYSTAKDGRIAVSGCWTIDGEFVLVRWNDGDLYSYPVDRVRMAQPAQKAGDFS